MTEAMYPACVAVGIAQGDCCPNGDHVTLGCCNGFPKVAEDWQHNVVLECSFKACNSPFSTDSQLAFNEQQVILLRLERYDFDPF